MAAAYLADKQSVVAEEIGTFRSSTAPQSYAQLSEDVLYFDNKGQMAASAALWSRMTGVLDQSAELTSARAYMLAQIALDRALAGNCSETEELAGKLSNLRHGPEAGFHAGVAEGLCGDSAATEATILWLKQEFPQSTAVAQRYIPELEAVAALADKDAAKALEVLATIAPPEGDSLAPYLRGMAHMAQKQPLLATADFQTVLAHRGLAFASGSNVYPMAEMGLARASEAAGDKALSATAYRRFAALWAEGDRLQPGLSEDGPKLSQFTASSTTGRRRGSVEP
jgi:eukaryotic-like serine/threonine-protein kinase